MLKDDVTDTLDWQAKWIRNPGPGLCNWKTEVRPAPFLRKTFLWDESHKNAKIRICGLGYYELYMNGEKVGDHVLDPVVSQYNQHVHYVTYDINKFLVKGTNVLGVILGNGWYNSHTPDVWHFDKASWRDYPKLFLQLDADSDCILISDDSWKTTTGPILFDGLRNGETYDARLELDGWLTSNYNDDAWNQAECVNPPGGCFREQTMPPCKVMQTIPAKKQWNAPKGTVYDINQNMAGWARITVTGEAGAKITLHYGEKLDENRNVSQKDIERFILGGTECQTDHYILKGKDTEIWEPHFTYHGFQYVQATIEGQAKIIAVDGRVVHTAFDKIGSFSCSNDILNKLQKCTEWSYISNFVGIPTDCPHREKNGWLGDAQLAAETGLNNYNSGSSYAQWIGTIVDAQRTSGQLPGIVPSCGWGFNWGSGPAWDSALLLIPWYIYLYTGDHSTIDAYYPAMKKYVDYCKFRAKNNIVKFGLGDWAHVDANRMVDNALTDTGYFYADTILLAKFANITGRKEDQQYYEKLAGKIKEAFNKTFYKGNGIYAKGEQTAMGCALYQNLVEDSEKEKVLKQLVNSIHATNDKPDFGILGAKYIPRVLAENGQIELAYTLLTQAEFPGWVYWLKNGANTLWESWPLTATSCNHIMYGDISAWMYQYLAGIIPEANHPGFKQVRIQPHPVKALDWVKAKHKLSTGTLSVHWKKEKHQFILELNVPKDIIANVVMPDGSTQKVSTGQHQLQCQLECPRP